MSRYYVRKFPLPSSSAQILSLSCAEISACDATLDGMPKFQCSPSMENFHPLCWMPSHADALNATHRCTEFWNMTEPNSCTRNCAEFIESVLETCFVDLFELVRLFSFLSNFSDFIDPFYLILSNFLTLLACLAILLTFLD